MPKKATRRPDAASAVGGESLEARVARLERLLSEQRGGGSGGEQDAAEDDDDRRGGSTSTTRLGRGSGGGHGRRLSNHDDWGGVHLSLRLSRFANVYTDGKMPQWYDVISKIGGASAT